MLIPKKYHIHVVGLLALSVMMLYPVFAKRIDPQVLNTGTVAAEDFLRLVDTEQYEESWNTSSALMREKIILEVWNRQIPAMRKRVGKNISREQTNASMSDWAEKAPDGQYLTLKYASSFEHQKEALETIILKFNKYGQWRVAGYFIK